VYDRDLQLAPQGEDKEADGEDDCSQWNLAEGGDAVVKLTEGVGDQASWIGMRFIIDLDRVNEAGYLREGHLRVD
jgi:hypothetical protein